MRWIKVTTLLSAWALFFALMALFRGGAWLFRFPGRWKVVAGLTRILNILLIRILSIKITVEGDHGGLKRSGAFVVSNHVSYVDGFVLGSLFPVVYVSKKEVRGWPVIGQWTALCGTIYVDRQRKDKIPLLIEEIAGKLRETVNILIFPEGTSTDGERLLPFQSVPFAAALRTKATVVPVTLAYKTVNGRPVSRANRDQVYWYGDMEFFDHFWNLLALSRIEVSVKIHRPIKTALLKNNSSGRKQVSQVCYDVIARELNLKDPGGRRPGSCSWGAS
jgi:1-acyl-sn-glycerol-3-phosphate acyltransferase